MKGRVSFLIFQLHQSISIFVHLQAQPKQLEVRVPRGFIGRATEVPNAASSESLPIHFVERLEPETFMLCCWKASEGSVEHYVVLLVDKNRTLNNTIAQL